MRIAFVSPYPPQRDGIGDYTAALASAMRDAGHEVMIITPRRRGNPAVEILGDLGTPNSLLRRLRAFGPDVLHVQFAVAAFGARTLALLKVLRAVRSHRVRVVLTAHEVTRDTALMRAPGRLLYKHVADLADLTIVHTQSAFSELVGRIGVRSESVMVLPHPRRLPPRATTDSASLRDRYGIGVAPLLLAFGFIHVDKGLQDLVEALGRLEPGAAHLVVAGGVRRRSGLFRVFEIADRRCLAQMQRSVIRLGLGSFVHVTGYVPDGEVRPWFEAASAAVLPYRRIEQSGVGSLAATLGVPVLTSTVGNLTADYGSPRWSFPPANPAQLALVLDDFLRSPRGAAGPNWAGPIAGVDLPAVAAATLDAYYRVIGQPHVGMPPV
jgi:glycosyltransferase involved in cell wall biosynthesis